MEEDVAREPPDPQTSHSKATAPGILAMLSFNNLCEGGEGTRVGVIHCIAGWITPWKASSPC